MKPEQIARILREAQFSVSVGPNEIVFENSSLLGFIVLFDTAESLLSRWADLEGEFLRRHNRSLRDAGGKAWNIYSVFLAIQEPSVGLHDLLLVVEEDLTSTRKIARAAISTESSVRAALLPLLPLQAVGLEPPAEDFRQELINRPNIRGDVMTLLLDGDQDAIERFVESL